MLKQPENYRSIEDKLQAQPKKILTIEDAHLTAEELVQAKEFFKRLSPQDRASVSSVIAAVYYVSEFYFSQNEHHKNADMFVDEKRGGFGTPFFGVYLMAGYLTKQGERKDIDLLVANNSWWTEAFMAIDGKHCGEYQDPSIYEIAKQLGPGFKFVLSEPGAGYTIGCDHKCCIKLTPTDKNCKPIDLNYVRGPYKRGEETQFTSEEDFYSKDVDEQGKQLPRLALYRNSRTIDPALVIRRFSPW